MSGSNTLVIVVFIQKNGIIWQIEMNADDNALMIGATIIVRKGVKMSIEIIRNDNRRCEAEVDTTQYSLVVCKG